jgi:hypothetical protein
MHCKACHPLWSPELDFGVSLRDIGTPRRDSIMRRDEMRVFVPSERRDKLCLPYIVPVGTVSFISNPCAIIRPSLDPAPHSWHRSVDADDVVSIACSMHDLCSRQEVLPVFVMRRSAPIYVSVARAGIQSILIEGQDHGRVAKLITEILTRRRRIARLEVGLVETENLRGGRCLCELLPLSET